MVNYKTKSGRIFDIFNYVVLITFAILCIVPMVHVLAISLSGSTAVAANKVTFWPIDFTLASYKYALGRGAFLGAFLVSFKRVALGLIINLSLIILTAYPLSKENRDLNGRTVYAWILFITMIFNGGLIPTYLVVNQTGIIDTVWALILPRAVPVFNVVLMLNFFRQIPRELDEAAFIDGAGHWTILFKIYLPLSLPVIATISLYVIVFHWNSWFDGIIYMRLPENYPLQSYLRTVVVESLLENNATSELDDLLKNTNERTFKSAQIFLAAIPVLVVYPFLQKFFVKGMVVGSVKG